MGDQQLRINERQRPETSPQAAFRLSQVRVAVQNVGRALPGIAAEVSYIKPAVKLTEQIATNATPTVAKEAQYIHYPQVPITGAEVVESQPADAGVANIIQETESIVVNAAKPAEINNKNILVEAEKKVADVEYNELLEEARKAVLSAQVSSNISGIGK